jgi:hypothetical protein
LIVRSKVVIDFAEVCLRNPRIGIHVGDKEAIALEALLAPEVFIEMLGAPIDIGGLSSSLKWGQLMLSIADLFEFSSEFLNQNFSLFI